MALYRQYDGYPSGHGQELADFLNGKRLVNGYGDPSSKTEANGVGCLAALLVAHLKKDQIGDIYITSQTDSQEYNYTVYKGENGLRIKCESGYDGFLFDVYAKDFDSTLG